MKESRVTSCYFIPHSTIYWRSFLFHSSNSHFKMFICQSLRLFHSAIMWIKINRPVMWLAVFSSDLNNNPIAAGEKETSHYEIRRKKENNKWNQIKWPEMNCSCVLLQKWLEVGMAHVHQSGFYHFYINHKIKTVMS